MFAPALLLAATLLFQAAREPAGPERLWRHRNLGKAFYENPTTHAQAVEEFRRALELAPDSFQERLNYGLALLHVGQVKEGIAELHGAHPDVPIYTAVIDPVLNDHGYIVPGLGDAGDRIYGTK